MRSHSHTRAFIFRLTLCMPRF